MYAQIREFGIFSLREDSTFILIVFYFFLIMIEIREWLKKEKQKEEKETSELRRVYQARHTRTRRTALGLA